MVGWSGETLNFFKQHFVTTPRDDWILIVWNWKNSRRIVAEEAYASQYISQFLSRLITHLEL